MVDLHSCRSNKKYRCFLYMFPSTQLLKKDNRSQNWQTVRDMVAWHVEAFISKNSLHFFLSWRCVIVLAGGSSPGMLQAVHQHTDSLLNLLMKVCNKMSPGTKGMSPLGPATPVNPPQKRGAYIIWTVINHQQSLRRAYYCSELSCGGVHMPMTPTVDQVCRLTGSVSMTELSNLMGNAMKSIAIASICVLDREYFESLQDKDIGSLCTSRA